MIGVLIVSHGGLAEELLRAAERINGRPSGIDALSLPWEEDCDLSAAKLRTAVSAADQGDGVLILADIFGATPCNLAMKLLRPGGVEVVSGVNLPLVVRLACGGQRALPLGELALWCQNRARAAVEVGSQRISAGTNHELDNPEAKA